MASEGLTYYQNVPEKMGCGSTPPLRSKRYGIVREVACWYPVDARVKGDPVLTAMHVDAASAALMAYVDGIRGLRLVGDIEVGTPGWERGADGIVEQLGMGWQGGVAPYAVVVQGRAQDTTWRSRWRLWREGR